MIELWPAVDLIAGKSVRLTEGDYATEEIMTRTPEEAIRHYHRFKAVKRIHLVDLIGARERGPRELDTIEKLIQLSKLPVEVGGGIRNEATIREYLDIGASYLVIGTQGLMDPEWLSQMARSYPGRLYLGLDAKGTEIAVNGWQNDLGRDIFDFIDEIGDLPLGGVIYTDIRRDGRMEGPSFELTSKLVESCPLPIIASGGVRNKQDIDRLEALGVQAAIIGKAANTDRFWEAFQ